ncbi:MAG: hypothetical protein ABR552_03655 [Actinomycetota bacterium]
MIIPDRLFVGVPVRRGETPPAPHAEVGSDWADLPKPAAIRAEVGRDRTLSMIASPILTHRRNDPRYKLMKEAPPEHAAVGHFERSRWTDEAWEHCNDVARGLDAGAAVFQTPVTFKANTEHATRLENFVAHAMRPGLVLAWEWAKGSWPDRKAMELCDRIGAIPVVDPTEREIPEAEYVYLRVRGGASGRATIKDDDLKKIALCTRDRLGWIIFSNKTGASDAARLLAML